MEPPIQTDYLSSGVGHDLDLHGGGGQGLVPLLHAGVDAFEHGGAAGQQDVAVHLAEQVLAIWQTVKPAHCAL